MAHLHTFQLVSRTDGLWYVCACGHQERYAELVGYVTHGGVITATVPDTTTVKP